MNDESYRFKVGEFECVALNDGNVTYTADKFFGHAPAERVQQALSERRIPPDKIPSPYTCLAINTGREWVLLDTGAGSFFPTTGNLTERLRAAGIDPAEIATVVLTHGHPDHLGGNVDAEGQPVFPRARYVLCRQDWEHFVDHGDPEQDIFARIAQAQLLPIRSRVDPVESNAEITPGIQLVPAPGHTPGQVAVLLASGSEQLLYISDVVLHELHLRHADWYPVYDVDRDLAGATKRHLFDRAAADRTLVHAFHFPFPGLGHVVQKGNGWEWQPVRA